MQEDGSVADPDHERHRDIGGFMRDAAHMQGEGMLTRETIIEQTRDFIMKNFLYMRPDVVIEPASALLERGIIDSLGVVELLSFVEETFAVAAADEEITEENFGSLDSIAQFVQRKRAVEAA
jgi:acyl carrier protein